ncbi:MAG: minor capsid protein [Zoogloeaceae bacterium]|nr:minor capsid protein [Zoogloeaceae bacterium]
MPPKEAVAYLAAKGYVFSGDWEEVWQEAHRKAFTVAQVARQDILRDIRQAVEKALAEGQTAAWFERELTQALKAKGWWGKEAHIEPDGEIRQVQLGSPRRLETIYRTNTQTAYMAGRYKTQVENAEDRPYWKYVAVMDSHTRRSHAAMNGKIFRWDDPIWQSCYPPNGFGCRCRVMALSEDDLAGGQVESSAGKMGKTLKLVSRRTGEMRETATYTMRNPNDPDKQLIFSPDVGWSYNPGTMEETP